MLAKVNWIEGMTFLGESGSGHNIVMDGNGGDKAPSPMEMVLMAAGGCSSVDVVAGLKSQQQCIEKCEAQLTTQRREQAPKLFTQINIHFVISGQELDEEIVAQVAKDSLEKYCSVCLMLGSGVEMTHSYEIV
ncbi:OsmC family protein [Aliivibrio kagoshimensis]|uniref:OsmC family protein n=1 Tax=Aliivibrio kagoshimensis TaxID=2910230 RepID=UPI003D0B811F